MQTGEHQYLRLARQIIEHGEWVENKRTGKRTKVIIGETLKYDCSEGLLPLVTTRKSYWKMAINEMIGYLRGYSSAAEFRKLGVTTWDANANENKAWLGNAYRKGDDDMGRVYGVQGRSWVNHERNVYDQLKTIYWKLCDANDDRALIMTFWNPGELHMGCLNSCMHTHQFSLVNDTLHLNSSQRSVDVPLGLVFNMVQASVLLMIMARITGYKAGVVKHDLVNCHIYEDQIDHMKLQLERLPFTPPSLEIDPLVKTLGDIEHWVTADNFELKGYQHHDPIKFPFAV